MLFAMLLKVAQSVKSGCEFGRPLACFTSRWVVFRVCKYVVDVLVAAMSCCVSLQ